MDMPNSNSLVYGTSEFEDVEKSVKAWRAARKVKLAAGEGAIARRTKRVTGANAKEATAAIDDSVRGAEAAVDRSSALVSRRIRNTALIVGGAASLPILSSTVPIYVNNKTKVKKAQTELLPIPAWAYSNFAPSRPVGDPLSMYAGGRMMAYGMNNMKGKINWPWRKDRMSRGANQYVQGRAMVYAPLGSGKGTM